MASKNSEDIWNAVCAMNQMAVPDSVEGGQMFWTAATTPGQVHAQIPRMQKLVNELLAQMPLPVYAVFGNAVAVDLRPSAIALTWAGFGVSVPHPLDARQDAEDLRRTMLRNPFEWRWTWHFDDARHLRMIDITVQDGRCRVYSVADWTLAANPVTVSSQWSDQCVDDIVVTSDQSNQWLSVTLLPLFELILDSQDQWVSGRELRLMVRRLANAASHGWLYRWPVFFIPGLWAVFMVLMLVGTDAAALPGWMWLALATGPGLLGGVGYFLLQTHAWRRICRGAGRPSRHLQGHLLR